MCDPYIIEFGKKYLPEEQIRGKRVIEVGSLDVNGSLRSDVEKYAPSNYVGVDLVQGPGVDQICPAEKLLEKFGQESFDILLSTEVLEHVRDWRKAVSNFKQVLKPGGMLVLTTRSLGKGYHGWPNDFWRFELTDIQRIFSDFTIEVIEKDPWEPGVFLKARKPAGFLEINLLGYKLYSMVENKKSADIPYFAFFVFRAAYTIKNLPSMIIPKPVKRAIRKVLGVFGISV